MASGWRESYYRYREFFLNITALYKQKADLRAFLEIVLSMTTVIVFLLFALKPTALTIISLLQEISEKRQTLASLTQKVSDLQTASTLLQKNQNYIADIDNSVPDIPNPDVLSKQIEGIASGNSVTLLGISVNQVTLVGTTPTRKTPGVTPLPGNANEMPFSLSVEGSYSNLLGFISSFENLRIAVKIDSLAITSSLSDKGRVIVAVISGRVPYVNGS